jgi:hypothetical protein
VLDFSTNLCYFFKNHQNYLIADAVKSSFDALIDKLCDAIGKPQNNLISIDAFKPLCDLFGSEYKKHFPSSDLPPIPVLPASLPPSPLAVSPKLKSANLPLQPKEVPTAGLPKPKKTFAEIARSAVQSCSDVSSKSKTALQHVVARRSTLPMRQRLLPLEVKLHDNFEERLNQTRFVYFRGIQRMSFSDLRFLFQNMGFQYRELLHFSFLGNGVTSILCQNESIASRLVSLLCSEKDIFEVSINDPSLPLPRKDGSMPTYSAEFLDQCKNAYIARVSREILFARDLLVSIALQCQVPSCGDAITNLVRQQKRDSAKVGVARP